MAEMPVLKRDRESVLDSIEIKDINELMFGCGLEMDAERKTVVDYKGKKIHIHLKSVSKSGTCPYCNMESTLVHGKGFRHPQWMPIQGMTAYAHIELNRYKCINDDCPAKTFTEEPDNVKSFQHRSDMVNTFILALSIFCSDTVAALICSCLGILVSHDSINRMLDNITVEDNPDIDFVGIDDVSLRKGQTYHTVIYDGNDHHLLALLNGRDGSELKEWLKNHPKIHTVARDRAGAYANAIRQILPDSLQVADRFHLLQNLIKYLNDIFKENIPSKIFVRTNEVLDEEPEKIKVEKYPVDLKEFDDVHYDNSPPIDEKTGEAIAFCDKTRFEGSKQYKIHKENREEKYRMIISLRKECKESVKPKKKELAQKYGLSTMSVNKYLDMTDEEVENVLEVREYRKREKAVNDYLNIIYKMLKDNYDPAFIYSCVIHSGYSDSAESLKSHIRAISLNNFAVEINKYVFVKDSYPEDVTVISRYNVLKYITVNDKEKMKGTDVEKYFDIIKEHYPVIKQCEEIWNSFHDILMGSDPEKLDEFIEKYEDSPIKPFISGIKKDIAPVKAAISSEVSSGFVEGGNCRYKATKRLMFGKSGIRHLFLKTYATSTIMRTGKNVKELLS